MPNKIIVPILSMRSHESGDYALLKDGNLQLHLARASYGDFIVVPKSSVDFDELVQRHRKFTFVQLEQWPENAYETRKNFWAINASVIAQLIKSTNCQYLVTDITGCPIDICDIIYNFNITKDPDLDRPYIDGFLPLDVESVHKSYRTFVLNERQKINLIKAGAPSEKIIVSQRVLDPSNYFGTLWSNNVKVNEIFHPFRISDKCYKFNEVLEYAHRTHQDVVITDPNDSYIGSEYESLAASMNVKVTISKLTKAEYYETLSSRPLILYFEDPNKVFHPGLAELLYFGCRIKCPYQLPNVDDLIVKGDLWLS